MAFNILWADDEIDLLKPHLLFLRSKGYDVATANNGRDALDMVQNGTYDLVILDENMPGLTGLETLSAIKQTAPHIPVIMITKSEEENIMDQAVGNKIADYLIKPVNPNQILLALKKHLHSEQLVTSRATSDYSREFGQLSQQINSASTIDDWYDIHSRLVFWDMELTDTDTGMNGMLEMQKNEANSEFNKFVRRQYETWVSGGDTPPVPGDGTPLMSPRVVQESVFPLLDAGHKVCLMVIDNFRLDQWRAVQPLLAESFNIDERLYTSILPTATQYARNAIFSGLMPVAIERMFPDLWVDEDADESKNINESPLLETQFRRFRRQCRFSYTKVNDGQGMERLLRDFNALKENDLNVMVFNFIDMMSHARTESKMIRELAGTNAAYRSLSTSWFRHSGALDFLRRAAAAGWRVVLTTDHGTIRVTNPIKVVGDKGTNTNLRYKVGKNLAYNSRQVYEIKKPEHFGLPSPNVSSVYIFAGNRDFFAYPNNYNHYVQYYTDTFQHGGISLDEMLIPLVTLTPKG